MRRMANQANNFTDEVPFQVNEKKKKPKPEAKNSIMSRFVNIQTPSVNLVNNQATASDIELESNPIEVKVDNLEQWLKEKSPNKKSSPMKNTSRSPPKNLRRNSQ